MSTTPPGTDGLTASVRVRLASFRLRERAPDLWVAQAAADQQVLFLDRAGAQVLLALDEGRPLGEAYAGAGLGACDEAEATALLTTLEAASLVAEVGGRHGRHTPARLPTRPPARLGVSGRLAYLTAGAAVVFVTGSFVLRPEARPSGEDLLIPGLGWPLALTVTAAVAAATSALHEFAHVAAGRRHGGAPRIRLGRHGVFVATTDLTHTWAWPRRQQLEALAAGTAVDVTLLAPTVGALLMPATAAASDVLRVLCAVLAARLLWQCQWYLRTDVYFLAAAASNNDTLRRSTAQAARIWAAGPPGRRTAGPGRDDPLPDRGVRGYLCSLPLAVGATVLLWAALLLPFGRALVNALRAA